ncbi:MAG: alpha/beta fold hydrolase [Vulcanimicrobiaceae bacterium]
MAQAFDLELTRGRLRAQRFGDGTEAVPLLCVPGLSSNSRAFDALGEYIERRGGESIAFDLRGRGWSDLTAPGSYGWENHARDIFEAADALGVQTFDFVGHSMGAFIGMTAASLDNAHRIRRLVLIDAAGIPTTSSLQAIGAGLKRLDRVFSSEDAYIEAIRSAGLVAPWNEYWERHYRYDLVSRGSSVAPRTALAAVTEDAAYGATHDPRQLWPLVSMPTLLMRSTVPLGTANDAFVLTKEDYIAFLNGAKNRQGLEVAENHFGIVCAAATCAAIVDFLRP